MNIAFSKEILNIMTMWFKDHWSSIAWYVKIKNNINYNSLSDIVYGLMITSQNILAFVMIPFQQQKKII